MEKEYGFYEKKFRDLEKTFRPFNEYKHSEVIDSLAEVVKEADLAIERRGSSNIVLKTSDDKNIDRIRKLRKEVQVLEIVCFVLGCAFAIASSFAIFGV